MHGVDSPGKAGRDLSRAGDGTADDEGERTGLQRLDGLFRVVDVALGDDLCRTLCGQLVDKVKINVIDALGLGRIAAHGRAHKVSPGFRAEHGILEVVAVGHHQLVGVFFLDGTDELGRDVLSRILYGSRLSLTIGILPSIISLVVGIFFGLLAGYFGGWVDYVIMRLADIMLSIPSLLLAMVVMYTLGQSTVNLFIALSLTSWASVARVVRSQTLSLKESEYVEAARSIGVSNGKIMLKHILPNCIPSLIVLFTLNVPSAILSESSLSFLGIGAQPPAASWGLMVNQSKQFLFTQPWLALAPCIAIMIVVLAFNFLGDGLRDVLDPYMKNQ